MSVLWINQYLHARCTYPTCRFRSLPKWCSHLSKIRSSILGKDQEQRSKIHQEPRSVAHWLRSCKTVIRSELPVCTQSDIVTLANKDRGVQRECRKSRLGYNSTRNKPLSCWIAIGIVFNSSTKVLFFSAFSSTVNLLIFCNSISSSLWIPKRMTKSGTRFLSKIGSTAGVMVD